MFCVGIQRGFIFDWGRCFLSILASWWDNSLSVLCKKTSLAYVDPKNFKRGHQYLLHSLTVGIRCLCESFVWDKQSPEESLTCVIPAFTFSLQKTIFSSSWVGALKNFINRLTNYYKNKINFFYFLRIRSMGPLPIVYQGSSSIRYL